MILVKPDALASLLQIVGFCVNERLRTMFSYVANGPKFIAADALNKK